MNPRYFKKSVLTAVLLFASFQASATAISLDFNSLPSAQGWMYVTSGAPETDVFSVAGGVLSMNGTLTNAAYYKLDGVVDPALPFSLAARARVSSGGQALAFYVAAAGQFIGINLSPATIIDETNGAFLASLDNTTFHDYRMDGAFGTGYQLFIDNVPVASGAFRAYGPNLLILGDSGSFGGGRAEITAFSFQQTQVPEPATLFLVLSGIGILATTRFGGGARGVS
jgi:hypothetical protein